MLDLDNLWKLANRACLFPSITINLDKGTADIPSKFTEEYREAVANPLVAIELLEMIEWMKNCQNCSHKWCDQEEEKTQSSMPMMQCQLEHFKNWEGRYSGREESIE